MRGTRLADFHRLAERLGKSCGRRRGACAGALQAARLARTTIDTIAEFLLGCANLGQERDRIERAITGRVAVSSRPCSPWDAPMYAHRASMGDDSA